jgi:hypothetical protein
MIISHSKQVCFWKIPRTGSTSIEVVIRLAAGLDYSQDLVMEGHFFPGQHHNIPLSVPNAISGQPGHTRTHLTPRRAILLGLITQAQYDSYQNFCIVRNPVARLVSAHALGFSSADWDVEAILRDRVAGSLDFALFKPQVRWLTEGNITPLPFSDYDNSARTVLTAFGLPAVTDVPKITRRHPHWEQNAMQLANASPNDRARINTVYADDAALNT